jgi:dTDP-4-amino-4,6-dideoxygalactose transaminase
VPTVSFIATAEAVVNAGARPVFADVDPWTWCLTAETVEPALTERTAAILPVHLFGNPAPVGELTELARARRGRDVPILEDAAQAVAARLDGRRVGALGDAAIFSFYPSKNLAGFGDGGAIVTDDDDVAQACRLLRTHGSEDKHLYSAVGYNSRLDEVQAAALRVLLPELDEWTRARRAAAGAYRELGLGDLVELPIKTAGAECCYHLFVVSTAERDALAAELGERGIGNRVYYTPTLDRQPSMEPFSDHRPLPGAEKYAATCLALPMGPALDREQVELVVRAVGEVLG